MLKGTRLRDAHVMKIARYGLCNCAWFWYERYPVHCECAQIFYKETPNCSFKRSPKIVDTTYVNVKKKTIASCFFLSSSPSVHPSSLEHRCDQQ